MTNKTFSVWAPYADDVVLHLDDADYPMRPAKGDWWISDIEQTAGSRYGFKLRKGDQWTRPLPDPRSRKQPDGVHGLSEVVNTAFDWTDQKWLGRNLAGMVIYELHVGAFTAAGTFEAAIEKLDYLVGLGVNAIELLPVQPCGGKFNWGYDGVNWFAVTENYGGPEGLKKFLNACHLKGISVLLDVVYNHFGPEGNYTGMFGPYTSGGSTGWGEVINISGPQSDEVRRYILDTVKQWLGEFHIDGLRLDAIHAYDDRLAFSIMEEIRIVADEISARDGRPRVLIAESDLNDPRVINSRSVGGYGMDGQWVDDIHHGVHVLVSGEDHAYYCDYNSIHVLAETIRRGWWFNGEYSTYRGRKHGRALNLEHTPAWQLVTYTTTHDQSGNRAQGDRPSMNLTPTQQVLKAAVIFFLPITPMLFMGEEFGAQTPFPFFCDHSDDFLRQATFDGRLREFAAAGWQPSDVADPTAKETFLSAKLDWDFDSTQQDILAAYTTLLRLRGELGLTDPDLRKLNVVEGDDAHRWIAIENGGHRLVANFSESSLEVPFGGELVYSFSSPKVSDNETTLGPWEFAVITND